MAINLVSLVSQFLTPQLVGSLARAVGVNEAVAQKLVAAAIPTILAALATTAAAPGGAQKLADAVSNSDPDLLSKLTGAISGGNVSALSEGANLLSGLLGGSGLSSVVGALSQFSGAPQGAAQSAVGAVAQSVVGTIGQQDPSNWSDASSIASMLSSQKSAISAALPPELSKALGATGLLAGLGSLGAAAAQTASSTVSSATSAASAATSAAANRAQAASTSSGFPMWAIILLVIIVLAAIWWFMTQNKQPEPAKTGMLQAPVEAVLLPLPGPST
jgi:cobalamin biosynthesis Mg chelatase CobN